MDIVKGNAHCPNYIDIKLLPCIHPPQRALLFQVLQSECKKKGVKLGIKKHEHVCVAYMLSIMSTLNMNHLIFQENFNPKDNSTIVKLVNSLDPEFKPAEEDKDEEEEEEEDDFEPAVIITNKFSK